MEKNQCSDSQSTSMVALKIPQINSHKYPAY